MEKVDQQEAPASSRERLDPNKRVAIPMTHLPIFRTELAIQDGVERRIMFKTWGGIGDQICAEPTLRYALKMFKDCEISLASELPELFSHLQFKKVFDLNEEMPNYKRYLLFDTITPPDESNLVWQFFSHMLVNCVDFPSMCALRQQLPVADRVIQITGKKPENFVPPMNMVVVHPGKHWASKTFPKDWWDRLLASLRVRGITPIIIGANADDNRGTVDVNPDGCIDLRNKLSMTESVWICQNAKVVLTNDSAPLHMAASGNAWIGFVATCKHPDMITHWRRSNDVIYKWNNEAISSGEDPSIHWQWREKNFGKGGIWEVLDYCPNKKHEVSAEFVPPEMLRSWLPEPKEMADWAAEKAL